MLVLNLMLIGLAVALDPLPLTAFLIVLPSKRGTIKGAAFVFGWLVSLAIVVTITVLATGNNPPRPATVPSLASLAIKIALGLVLVRIAIRHIRARGQPRPPKNPPRWQEHVDSMSPWFAMVLALALQPWVLLGAGAATVVEAKLSSWASFLALVVYCVLASSSYLGDGGLRRGPARGQPGAAGQVPGLDRRPYRPGDHRRALGITPSRIASSARSARYSFGRHGCRRCSTVSWWRRIKILAIRQASSRRDSRSHEAVRVIRRKTNGRHMTGDHHGQAAGMATLLVRAVDGILGTYKIVYRRELRPVITTGAQIMDQLFTPTQAPVPEHSHPPAPIPGLA